MDEDMRRIRDGELHVFLFFILKKTFILTEKVIL